MSKSLVVLGGTGFLGRHICMAGLSAGYNVTSLSSSGKLTNTTGLNVSSISQITWKQANVFDPTSYQNAIKSADAVVHSMGTIFDNPDYKQYINGGASLSNFMNLARLRFQGTNPMKRGNSLFDKLNRDSALTLANNFSKESEQKDKTFVYISAADWNPLAESGYIRSKRQAEDGLEKIDNLRSVFIRPGFMYDKQDSSSLRGSFGSLASTLGNAADHFGVSCISEKNPSLPVQTVANAVIESVADEEIQGVVELSALQKFASFS